MLQIDLTFSSFLQFVIGQENGRCSPECRRSYPSEEALYVSEIFLKLFRYCGFVDINYLAREVDLITYHAANIKPFSSSCLFVIVLTRLRR